MKHELKNQFLDKLKAGEAAIGCQLRSHSLRIAELMGYCGFDFIYIDTEHYICDRETIENLMRCCELSGIVPLVRIPDQEPGRISQFLDAGVTGIILPHLDTPEQAEAAIKAGKYAPIGERGFSGNARSAHYGFVDRKTYSQQANATTMMIGMIESLTAVQNLDAILETGIDALRIGPSDLAASMGLDGRSKEPAVQQLVDEIIAKCRAKGIPVGGAGSSVDEVVSQIQRGYHFVHFSSDLVTLQKTWSNGLAAIRQKLSPAEADGIV